MFLREVVSHERSARPVRHAEIVEVVENERGQREHRVVLSLGRVDRLDREEIRRLVTALSRYLETDDQGARIALLDVREFGIGFALHGLWRRFGLSVAIRRLIGRRTGSSHLERALFVLVVHHLNTPEPVDACYEWFVRRAWIPGARRVGPKDVERALAFAEERADEVHAVVREGLSLEAVERKPGPLSGIPALVRRHVEGVTELPFDVFRTEIGRIRAIERATGPRSVWETSLPSPRANDILARLGLTPPPVRLPRPAKGGGAQRRAT